MLAQIHIFFTYFVVGSNKDLSIFTGVEIWKMKSPASHVTTFVLSHCLFLLILVRGVGDKG